MPLFTATIALGSVPGSLSFLSKLFTTTETSSTQCSPSGSPLLSPISNNLSKHSPRCCSRRTPWICSASNVSNNTESYGQAGTASARVLQDSSTPPEAVRQSQNERSADWEAARSYNASGFIYEGRVEGFNGGGLLVRFRSLVGFLPFPQLSPSHFCKEPTKSIHEIAKGLTGSLISVKVIQAHEESRKLIFSEKEAVWSKFSGKIKLGDIFEARVGSVEDYGAFVHLRFPDGLYHLTGLVHVSEVSWDLVQSVRDVLSEGDEVKVKIISIDREKSRITLSIRQLEEDPLLETLEKVIPQDGSVGSDSLTISDGNNIEPLPGLETIFEELLREDGMRTLLIQCMQCILGLATRYVLKILKDRACINDVRISRQGFEKRVVSQDLQLWLSNAPPINQSFTLLARAGRQVQEIQLTTSLDQEGIKKALQRVLERVP